MPLLLGELSTSWAGERFHYLVSYRGLLSAMQQVNIADVWLAVGDADRQRRREARLSVSSAPFGLVESLYPFRMCAKTLFQRTSNGEPRSLVYGLENQSRKELEELLLWLDWPARRLHRFQIDHDEVGDRQLHAAAARLSDARQLLARLAAGESPGLPANGERVLPNAPVLDRLSLFLAMRDLRWAPEQQRRFAVAVDDEILNYRLLFKGRESIRVFGREWPSLRIEMTELDDDGEPGHIVTFWISDDARHLPLQGHSAHALGDFLMRLVEWRGDVVVDTRCEADGFAFRSRGDAVEPEEVEGLP